MKPEPLKGKWESIGEIGLAYSILMEFVHEDLKSAIDWLKERVQDMVDDESITCEQADDFDTFIDKAFEDVMKKD